MGGLEESATGMLGEMSKPISWGVPADKVCMKLYRKDQQICDLRYGKMVIIPGMLRLLVTDCVIEYVPGTFVTKHI